MRSDLMHRKNISWSHFSYVFEPTSGSFQQKTNTEYKNNKKTKNSTQILSGLRKI